MANLTKPIYSEIHQLEQPEYDDLKEMTETAINGYGLIKINGRSVTENYVNHFLIVIQSNKQSTKELRHENFSQ